MIRYFWFIVLVVFISLSLGTVYAQETGIGFPVLSSVFQQPRPSDEDIIYFRNKDVLRGKVLNIKLSINTPYGKVTVSTNKLAGISFEGAQANTESIVSVNFNRFTGIISDRVIQFKIGSSGVEIPIRKEKIRFILLKKTPGENSFADPKNKTNLFIMTNGDLLTGKPASSQLKIKTDYGDIPVSFSEIKTIDMQGGDNVVAVIQKKNGDTMRGTLVTEEMTVHSDLGAEVEAIYKDKFSKIFVDDGYKQIAAQFGIRQPVAGESDGALFPLVGQDILTINLPGTVEMKFRKIPAGKFTRGSPENEKERDSDEGPQRLVTITNPFYLGVYEVTQAQWKAVMGNNPSKFRNCGDDCPVETVPWEDVQGFINKLNQIEGSNKYRLPTEAEWEYACRAGTTTRYGFGDDDAVLGQYAWYLGNSGKRTHPAGQKKPNAWGLYDMHGNVWEWCQDLYGNYPAGFVTDPTGSFSGAHRVIRGGSWNNSPYSDRSANRSRRHPDYRFDYLGFRLARNF